MWNSSNEYYWDWTEGELWVDEQGQPLNEGTDDLLYHESWEWLMPVVESIEGIDWYDTAVVVTIRGVSCRIETVSYSDQLIVEFNSSHSHLKIENTYDACVEFIKRFNDSKI